MVSFVAFFLKFDVRKVAMKTFLGFLFVFIAFDFLHLVKANLDLFQGL